jgi:hypothetical protein
MTGLVPMPDDFRPSPAPEGKFACSLHCPRPGAGIAGQAAPAVVAGIGTADLRPSRPLLDWEPLRQR